MKFTRFIDLGGRQTDLYVYTAEEGASPWMIIRIKSVMKSDQGECIQVFVNVAGKANRMEEVLVSPEIWKLPALADRILTFSKNDMLAKIAEGGDSLPQGEASPGGELGTGDSGGDDSDLDDLDTSGILASDGGSGEDSDFDPSDVIAQANQDGGDAVDDPSSLIQQMNEDSEEGKKEE